MTILTRAGSVYMDITLRFLVVPGSTRNTCRSMDDILSYDMDENRVSSVSMWPYFDAELRSAAKMFSGSIGY